TSFDHYGVGIGYTLGAISVSANYGEFDYDDGTDAEGFGISAGYDLGGGAAVQFGYGDSDTRGGEDIESFSLGVRMNF
ncbi:MAG: porin, partial [Pseudomonadota bacterium]